MSIYMIIASLFHKRVTSISAINFSLLILLIINPYSILDIGMQLSYGGTIGIIFLNKPLKKVVNKKLKKKEQDSSTNLIRKLKEKIMEIVLISLSANIIILPITLYHFNTLSITFLISNLLASPLLGAIIILGFLTIIISFIFEPIAKILTIPLKILIEVLLQVATRVGNIPFSQVYLKTPKIYLICAYYLAIAMYILYKKLKNKNNKRRIEKIIFKKVKKINQKKIVAFVLIITILFSIYNHIPQNLKINFIDVGQGDSTLVITPNNKTILIDGGGNKTGYDIGKNVLLPYLLNKGITKLDYIIVSHFDTDHVGGLLSLMENLKVGQVIISKQGEDSENYQKFNKIIKDKKIKGKVVTKGDKIQIEKNIYFDILWPDNSKLIGENILNNNSIVCKLCYKSFSMLFTGDIEEIAEREILKQYKDNINILNSTILKVGHHGSKTSSIQSFVEAVKPKIALIGVGKNNKFGHPNDAVIERLKKCGTKIYRTDQMGEIMLNINTKGKIKVKKFIEQERLIN